MNLQYTVISTKRLVVILIHLWRNIVIAWKVSPMVVVVALYPTNILASNRSTRWNPNTAYQQ